MKIFLSVVVFVAIAILPFGEKASHHANPIEIDTSRLVSEDIKTLHRYSHSILNHTGDLDFTSLVLAVIKAESGFDSTAVSGKNAVGLMQLIPSTAFEVSDSMEIGLSRDDLFDPEINIKMGIEYLRYLQGRLIYINDGNKRLSLVLASYNYGFRKVKQAFGCNGVQCFIDRANLCTKGQFARNLGGLPAETRRYIVKVDRYYRMYKNVFGIA